MRNHSQNTRLRPKKQDVKLPYELSTCHTGAYSNRIFRWQLESKSPKKETVPINIHYMRMEVEISSHAVKQRFHLNDVCTLILFYGSQF